MLLKIKILALFWKNIFIDKNLISVCLKKKHPPSTYELNLINVQYASFREYSFQIEDRNWLFISMKTPPKSFLNLK